MSNDKARWVAGLGLAHLVRRRRDGGAIIGWVKRRGQQYTWAAGGESGVATSYYAAQRAVRAALRKQTEVDKP